MKNKKEKECQGRYYVSGYETDDGKKVDGYYRTCWKHGEKGSVNSAQEAGTGNESNYPKNTPTKANPKPTDVNIPKTGNHPQPTQNPHPVFGTIGDVIGNTIGTAISVSSKLLPLYLEYMANSQRGLSNSYPSLPTDFGVNDNPLNPNTNLSRFDIKKTEQQIKNALNNVEGLLKKKEINRNDVNGIKNSALHSISSICDDIQYLSDKKSSLPKVPTVESAEIGTTIENDRKQTRENIYQSILMMYQANRALDKSFEPVETTDANYGEELKNYLRQKEEFKKINESLNKLYDISSSVNENTKGKIEGIRNNLNLGKSSSYGVPTGAAAKVENNKPYKVDNYTNQKIYSKIDELDIKIKELNIKMDKINQSNIKISKENILKIFKELEDIVKEIEKYYPISLKADEAEKQRLQWNNDTLKYWFDKVINKLPKTFNNAKRILLKFKHSDTHTEDIQLIQGHIEEIENILSENIYKNVKISTRIIEDIKYKVIMIIDNIRYRFIELEEEPIPEEILKKYPKPQNMSKENEAIFDYAIRNLYDNTKREDLRAFLIKHEGFMPFIYDDLAENKHELHPGDKIKGTKTIGYGFTTINGKPLVWGMRMTEQEADEILEKFIDENQRYIDLLVKVPLTQEQYDALVSIIFNKGYGKFKNSDIYKYLEKGDYINTSKAILEDGKKYHVETRREDEYKKFISDFPFSDND